ncbi:conjugative transfer signal peptidase TraF [Mesorhizobium sp. CAU 1741]|uniref:conjugative transfer signal peptidase TraF n=1 Tax=Mesorhizobium sp. CAU 1741 TaxID=3140366 RepID=UPI00325ACEBB
MKRGRVGIICVALLVALPIALSGLGWLGGFRINLTPSYPLGLWRIIPLHRQVGIGDLVFICPPPTRTFELARERGYVRSGLCPGWISPLIKTVTGLPGQRVEIGNAVTIENEPIVASTLQRTDGEGRMLAAHSGGFVPDDHVYLHSDFAGSYDSRYFGPIPADGLLGLAWPVITMAP